MAYFHKRGQKWYFTIDVGKKPDGSRDQKKVGGFKTKKEASLAAAEMEQDLANGIYGSLSKVVVYTGQKYFLSGFS